MLILPIIITSIALASLVVVAAIRSRLKWKSRGLIAEASSNELQTDLSEQLRILESERIHSCIDRTRLQHIEAVLDVYQASVIVLDFHGEVLKANLASHCLLKVTPEEACGRLFHDVLVDQQLIESFKASLSGIHAEGSTFEQEVMVNSEPIFFEVRIHQIEARVDQVPTLVAILRDLTHEREVAKLKSDFVSKASHELRTPLSSIAAYIEMLVDDDAEDEEAKHEYYSIISNETTRLQKMIDNLLDISRIEAGLMHIDRVQVNVGEIIDRAVTNIKPQAQAKDIDIRLQLAEVNLSAKVDGDMVYQVVVNLLSNAIKYTPNGGRMKIDVDTDNLTRSLHFSVTDTGLGIPPDLVDKVFEKFYRIENYKKVAQGTGLGLNLCRHIIETLHNGQIGLESTLGMGSRFWFTIPLGDSSIKAAA